MEYTRKEAADILNIGIEALRYYEKAGVIPTPSRSKSSYRIYNDEDLLRLKFIRRLKELGFSLKEILVILKLLNKDKDENKEILKDKITEKINEIENKIADLNALKEVLNASKNNPELGECEFLNLFYKNT